jgi:hypothetical protein
MEQFSAIELADDEKPALLRAYLKKWQFEVGVFFDGVGPDSSDAELARTRRIIRSFASAEPDAPVTAPPIRCCSSGCCSWRDAARRGSVRRAGRS